jgi:cell division septum initiation protein DivIVA
MMNGDNIHCNLYTCYDENERLRAENYELQKQVDELKEQLKSVQNSCQSKNFKITNLNAEKEALQNELNFKNGKPHYRYVVWNTKQNKRQFQSICEMTENGAYIKLFQKIGWDSAKYRFEVRRIKVDGVEVE